MQLDLQKCRPIIKRIESEYAWVRPAASRPKEEARNMNKAHAAAVLTAAALVTGMDMTHAASASVPVDTSPCHNKGWTTVYTNEVNLSWDWATGATSAELALVGMNGSVVTRFTEVTTNWLWQVFATDVPAAEDVYELTLTFYTDGMPVAGALTSRLAVVTGAFGPVTVDTGPESRTWGLVRGNAVIPYDAGWTNATAGAATSQLVIAKVGGMTQTNPLAAANGYYAWKLKQSDGGYGVFSLALTFSESENEWDALLTRLMGGTMIKMR